MGWMQRDGILHLTLVLPDGTRSLIPAAWTDLKLTAADNSPAIHNSSSSSLPPPLASVLDLLRTRTIVDALIRRLDRTEPADRGSTTEENKRETTNGFLGCHHAKTPRVATSLGKSVSRGAGNRDSHSSPVNQQGSLTGTRQQNSGEKP